MLSTLLCTFVCGLAPIPAGAGPLPETILAGSWSLNGNGHLTELVLKVDKNLKLTGSMYGAALTGSYDRTTKTIMIKRLATAHINAKAVQEYTGTLTPVKDSKPAQYTLEGKFKSLADGQWGALGVEYDWKAEAVRLPSPAEDIKDLQGYWNVVRVIDALNKETRLPSETRLVADAKLLKFSGNELKWDGNTVATLANDLTSETLEKEKGFKHFRLIMLTTPEGKGLLCSYSITNDGVELAYPHTTSCHRGSGQILYLKRAK